MKVFRQVHQSLWALVSPSIKWGLIVPIGRITMKRASQVALVVKNLPANAEDIRDTGSIPGLGRSPGGGHGNPLQYSCLENPHGQRRLVGYRVNGVAKSRTRLKWLSMHARMHGRQQLNVLGTKHVIDKQSQVSLSHCQKTIVNTWEVLAFLLFVG